MKTPEPLTPEDLEKRPRIVQALQFAETEDPAEIKAKVDAWVGEHGPYTHCLLWCGPQIITATNKPTTVAVPKTAEVVPCQEAGADILPITAALWKTRVRLDALPYAGFCLLPLVHATGKTEDEPWLVRMKKIGATKLLVARPPQDPPRPKLELPQGGLRRR